MNNERTLYVLGFAFTGDNRVLLIEKKRPDWQKGRLNGIGGHVEYNESSIDAMTREFREETGVSTTQSDWQFRGRMYAKDWSVFVFSMAGPQVLQAVTQTDERLHFLHVDDFVIMEKNCIENVHALIQLCRIPWAVPSGMWPRFELQYGWQCPDA